MGAGNRRVYDGVGVKERAGDWVGGKVTTGDVPGGQRESRATPSRLAAPRRRRGTGPRDRRRVTRRRDDARLGVRTTYYRLRARAVSHGPKYRH